MKPTKRRRAREFWIVQDDYQHHCCVSMVHARLVRGACIGKTKLFKVREILKPKGKRGKAMSKIWVEHFGCALKFMDGWGTFLSDILYKAKEDKRGFVAYNLLSDSELEQLKPHWTTLDALQSAYRKHVQADDSIGWDELGDKLLDALCNLMGNDEFIKWNEAKR